MIMRSSEATISEPVINKDKSRWLDKLARKAVHKHLNRIQKGELVIREDKVEHYFGQRSPDCNLCVSSDVLDIRV